MFAAIAAILLIAWILGFAVFHVTSGLIHLILLVAIISFVWHLFSGSAFDLNKGVPGRRDATRARSCLPADYLAPRFAATVVFGWARSFSATC